MVSKSDKYFFSDSITSINPIEWNNCVGLDHPFTRHEFLLALETSKSADSTTGWKPFHYIEIKKNKIIAVCPLYIKTHSYGEYIFDHAWADAYKRHGLNYYPKLQSAIPFTPVTGERILIHNSVKNKLAKKNEIINNIIAEIKKLNISSLHFNFLYNPSKLKEQNPQLLIRQGIQFHWKNNNYETFDDFLKTLSSRKRKVIKKERLCITKNELTVKMFTGTDIKNSHWDFFYKCYLNTTERKWGSTYLTKDFFYKIGKNFSDKVLLFITFKNDRMIASAINFISKTHLYGRLWGSLYDIPYLHFELCYYQAIDFAIKHKIQIVEAGAQGEHKLQRGYLPEKTWSLHWIKDHQFSEAINQYLDQEKDIVVKQKENLEQFSPFKNLD